MPEVSSVMAQWEMQEKGWWDGSGIQSTGCSCRGWGFDSRHLHIPSPEDPTPSFDLCRHCIHVNTHLCKQNTPIIKSNKSEQSRRKESMHMYCVWWWMSVIRALRRLRVRLGSGFSEGTGLIGKTCIRDLLIWITGCGPVIYIIYNNGYFSTERSRILVV